jgi:hypothetical protein
VSSTPSHPELRALSQPQQAVLLASARPSHLALEALSQLSHLVPREPSRPQPAEPLVLARPSHLVPEVPSQLSQVELLVPVRLLSQVLQALEAQVFLAHPASDLLVSPAHQAWEAQASPVHQASARKLPLLSVLLVRPQPARLRVLPALLHPTLVLLLLRAPWPLASLPLALLLLFCKRSKSMMGYDQETKKFHVFFCLSSNAERKQHDVQGRFM